MLALAIHTHQPLDYWMGQPDAVILTALELIEESNKHG